MTDDELGYVWSDGYQAGLWDASTCTHERGLRHWWNRTVVRWSRHRLPMIGKCHLYVTENPFWHDDEDDEVGE